MNRNNKKILTDENSNTLNKENAISPNENNHQKSQTISALKNLQYIFPFLNESKHNQDEYNNELNLIINEIITNNSSQFLQGKVNIIDKLISKHGNIKFKDIPQLKCLHIKIPAHFGMLNDFGYHLPNLEELNLEGSSIESISDIGTSFFNLKKLNVSSCGVKDLSGIICFSNLEELHAENNEIEDLIDIEMCTNLKFLYLNNNKIDNEDNLLFLNSCDSLQMVYIAKNPIAEKIKQKEINCNKVNDTIKIILD